MLIRLSAFRLLGLFGSRKFSSRWNIASVEGDVAWSASTVVLASASVTTSTTWLEPVVSLAYGLKVVNELPIVRLEVIVSLLVGRVLWAFTNVVTRF